MAIIAYISILSLIPFFVERNNKYVVYHAKQGLNLFIIEVLAYFASVIASFILIFIPILGWLVAGLLYLGVVAFTITLSIMGIVDVCSGKAKELPIINKLKIIK